MLISLRRLFWRAYAVFYWLWIGLLTLLVVAYGVAIAGTVLTLL